MAKRKRRSIPRVNIDINKSNPKYCSLYLIYRYSQGRLKYSTGITIPTKTWIGKPAYMVNENSTVIRNSDAINYNNQIRTLTSHLVDLIDKDNNISIDKVKSQLDSFMGVMRVDNVAPPTFNEYIPIYRDKQFSKGISEITLKKLDTLLIHLDGFDDRISFTDINEEFKVKYTDYLKEKTSVKSQNTLSKEFDLIIQIMKYSYDDTYIDRLGQPKQIHDNRIGLTTKLVVKRVKTSRHPLHKSELDILYDVKDLTDTNEYVRDLFLIMCYSSLRISDVLSGIRQENIISIGDNDYLQVHTYKGRNTKEDTLVTIPYFGRLKELVEKYKFDWHKITGQTINSRIKLIAENAKLKRLVIRKTGEKDAENSTVELWTTITNHTGRYTYISNALNDGASIDDLRKITGQSMKILLGYDKSNPFQAVERVKNVIK